MGETEKCDTHVVSLLIYCMFIITWPFPFIQAQIIKGIFLHFITVYKLICVMILWRCAVNGDMNVEAQAKENANSNSFFFFAFDLSQFLTN